MKHRGLAVLSVAILATAACGGGDSSPFQPVPTAGVVNVVDMKGILGG